MQRSATRTLAVLAGLTLGFVSAGYVPWPSWLGSASYAQSEPPPSPHNSPTEQAESPTPPASAHEAAGEIHSDAGQAAAAGLIPRDAQGQPAAPRWYRYVVAGIAGLFLAALGIGIPLSRLNREPSGDGTDHASH